MKNGGPIIVYILPQWCKLIKLCKSKWYVVNLELLGPPLGICPLFPVCNSQPCPTGMAVGWCTTDHWRIMSPRTLKFSGLLPWQKKWHFVSFSSISCYFTYFQLWPERKQSYSKICLWNRMHLRAIKMCPKDITILNFIYWAEQLLIPLVVLKHAHHHLSSQKSMQQSV